MSNLNYGLLAQYNSLTDPNLQGFFSKTKIRQHLLRTGLIDRKGAVVPDTVYRNKIVQKEQKKHYRQMLAHAIVQEAVDIERIRQSRIRNELQAIAKAETVRRIKGQSSTHTRQVPLLWPANSLPSIGRPSTAPLHQESDGRSDSVIRDNLSEDSKIYQPRPPLQQGSYRRYKRKNFKRPASEYRMHTVPTPVIRTPCHITMLYHGKGVNIPYDKGIFDVRDEITVFQQHCGGENLLVFKGRIKPNEYFTFESKRHADYQLGLSFYINGTYDCRISCCCEYRHKLNLRIGGKKGRFSYIHVSGAKPCYKCRLEIEKNKGTDGNAANTTQLSSKAETPQRDYSPSFENDDDGRDGVVEIPVEHKKDDLDASYDNDFDDDKVKIDLKKDRKTKDEDELSRRLEIDLNKTEKIKGQKSPSPVQNKSEVKTKPKVREISSSASESEPELLKIIKAKTEEKPRKNSWGDSSDEDTKLKKKAEATKKKEDNEKTWTVTVRTSDLKGEAFEGTDANVFICLIGDKGETERIFLEKPKSKNPFEAGSIDTFIIGSKDIGELRKIKIGHDCKGFGADWHVAKVEIADSSNAKKYDFDCNFWLKKSDKNDFGFAEKIVSLTPEKPVVIKDSNKEENQRKLSTNSSSSSSTTSSNSSKPVKTVKIKKKISSSSSSSSSSTARSLESPKQVEQTKPKIEEPKKIEDGIKRHFTVTVETSDLKGKGFEGTDANVFISLIGDKGESEKIFLKKPLNSKNPFETGNIDIFVIESTDVGEIKKIKLGHDCKGLGSDWHVARVKLDDTANSKKYEFECNFWLKDSDKNKSGFVERVVSPRPAKLAPSSSSDSSDSSDSSEESDEFSASVNQRAKSAGKRQVNEEKKENVKSNESSKPAEKQNKWTIKIYTSDLGEHEEGTDSNVYVTLIGTKASSQRIWLKSSENENEYFKAGSQRTFDVSCQDIGELDKIRISHDESGMSQNWHLQKVELTNSETKQNYTINVNRWFSREKEDGQVERVFNVNNKIGVAAKTVIDKPKSDGKQKQNDFVTDSSSSIFSSNKKKSSATTNDIARKSSTSSSSSGSSGSIFSDDTKNKGKKKGEKNTNPVVNALIKSSFEKDTTNKESSKDKTVLDDSLNKRLTKELEKELFSLEKDQEKPKQIKLTEVKPDESLVSPHFSKATKDSQDEDSLLNKSKLTDSDETSNKSTDKNKPVQKSDKFIIPKVNVQASSDFENNSMDSFTSDTNRSSTNTDRKRKDEKPLLDKTQVNDDDIDSWYNNVDFDNSNKF